MNTFRNCCRQRAHDLGLPSCAQETAHLNQILEAGMLLLRKQLWHLPLRMRGAERQKGLLHMRYSAKSSKLALKLATRRNMLLT